MFSSAAGLKIYFVTIPHKNRALKIPIFSAFLSFLQVTECHTCTKRQKPQFVRKSHFDVFFFRLKRVLGAIFVPANSRAFWSHYQAVVPEDGLFAFFLQRKARMS